jgi:hypothetical protein
LQVLNRDDIKTRRAAVFLSCDSQTSLPEVRFVFTFMLGQPYTLYFESMFVFLLKKNGVKRMQSFSCCITSRYRMYV